MALIIELAGLRATLGDWDGVGDYFERENGITGETPEETPEDYVFDDLDDDLDDIFDDDDGDYGDADESEEPDLISKEEFEKQRKLLELRIKLYPEEIDKLTELYNEYINGIDKTRIRIKELDKIKDNLEAIKIDNSFATMPTKANIKEKLDIIEKTNNNLSDIYDKLNDGNEKKNEEQKREIEEKIEEIKKKIEELKQRIDLDSLTEEDKQNIMDEINKLLELLKEYKDKLLEFVGLLKERMEERASKAYGERTPERLDSLADECKNSRDKTIKKEATPPERPAEREATPPERHAERKATPLVRRDISRVESPESDSPSIGDSKPRTPILRRTDESDGLHIIKLRPGHEAEDELWQRMRMPSYYDKLNNCFYHAVRNGDELVYAPEKIEKNQYSKEALKGMIEKILKDLRNR